MIPRSLARQIQRLAPTPSSRRLSTLPRQFQSRQPRRRTTTSLHQPRRHATTTTPSTQQPHSQPPQNTPAGDAAVDEITELYATAVDEFEIASESTEANATYAQEDRNAAREELEKVLEAYRKITTGEDGGSGHSLDGSNVGEEVRRRVGQRVRELEAGVKAMEERAMEHD